MLVLGRRAGVQFSQKNTDKARKVLPITQLYYIVEC